MAHTFYIIKSFVRNISFDTKASVQLKQFQDYQIWVTPHVEVSTSAQENNKYHLVGINIDLTATMNETHEPVYDCNLDYIAIVEIPDMTIRKSTLKKILDVEVPQALLDNIRFIILNLTREAGYPFVINDNIFGRRIRRSSLENEDPIAILHKPLVDEDMDEDKPDATERIDFRWIIKDMMTIDGAQFFLNSYTSTVGDEVLASFQSLPAYKSYFRFFHPIDYCHPDFEECDESVWPMLFQMLYGAFSAKCQVIDRGESLPEIKFSHENFSDTLISSLSLDDLKKLLSDLMINILTNISVNLVSLREMEEPVESICLMSQAGYRRLFRWADFTEEKSRFVDALYERIKECDIQTILYR